MNLKKRFLRDLLLYIIIDKKTLNAGPLRDIVSELKKCANCVIQFRDKDSGKESILRDSYTFYTLLSKTNIPFIVNDYIDIAKIVNSDGVHLGQDDLSIEIARKILGKDKIIGKSCHNLTQAKEAQERGADYIGIGPIFSTPTKPDYTPVGLGIIKEVRKYIKIPFFAIGGINENNLSCVLDSGAQRVSVCRAVCQAKSIRKTVGKFLHHLTQ